MSIIYYLLNRLVKRLTYQLYISGSTVLYIFVYLFENIFALWFLQNFLIKSMNGLNLTLSLFQSFFFNLKLSSPLLYCNSKL